MDIMELRTRLEEAPRIPLGVWPTPFMPMDGLRARLSAQGIECPRLWIKREDMTPLGERGIGPPEEQLAGDAEVCG